MKFNQLIWIIALLAIFGAAMPLLLSIFKSSFSPAASWLGWGMIWLCRARTRTTAFHVSLPISGRHLFLAHIVSSLSLIWTPSLAAAAVAPFCGPASHALAISLLAFSSAATLCFLILHSAALSELQAPSDMAWIAGSVLVIISLCLTIIMEITEAIGATIFSTFLILSAFLFFIIWRKIPKSFLLSHSKTDAYPVPIDAIRMTKHDYAAWKPIARNMLFGGFPIFCAGALLILLIYPWSSSIFIAAWIAFIWGAEIQSQGDWLQPFPVSKSAIRLLFLIPMFLVVLVGYALGIWIHGSEQGLTSMPPQLSRPADPSRINKATWNEWPPLEFWEWARGGVAQSINAPWGETCLPPTIRSHGFRIHNPYFVGDQNSSKFLEWQVSRATQAIYGKVQTLSDLNKFPLAHHRPILPMRILIIHISLILALSLIVIFPGELPPQPRWRFWAIIHFGFAPAVALAFLFSPGFRSGGLATINSIALRIAWILPDNPAAVLAIMLAFLAGLYWFADKLISRAEKHGRA
jgi:hypothetical protein